MKTYAPWLVWEYLTVPEDGIIQTNREIFRNETDDEILIERVTFIDPDAGEPLVRFGVEGQASAQDYPIKINALRNAPVMANAADYNRMFFQVSRPVLIPARSIVYVQLADHATTAVTATVTLIGQTANGRTFLTQQEITISADGTGTVNLVGHEREPAILTGVIVQLHETGTTTRFQGRRIKVWGGGMPEWSSHPVPIPLLSTETSDAYVYSYEPVSPIILEPGESFVAELFDTTSNASAVAYVGVLGYRKDLRS